MIISETQRLIYRQFTSEDFNNLYALDTDPEVMRFISGGIPNSEETTRNSLSRVIEKYKTWGHLGLWAAETKDTKEFIGWFAVKPLPGVDEIEVGYRLAKKYWGQGYATEGAREMVRIGYERAKLEKIMAITMPGNLASQNVLKKVGFEYVFEKPLFNPETQKEILLFWFEHKRGER